MENECDRSIGVDSPSKFIDFVNGDLNIDIDIFIIKFQIRGLLWDKNLNNYSAMYFKKVTWNEVLILLYLDHEKLSSQQYIICTHIVTFVEFSL